MAARKWATGAAEWWPTYLMTSGPMVGGAAAALGMEASNEDLKSADPNLHFELRQPTSKTIGKYPMTPRGIETGIGSLSWQYPDRARLPGAGAGPLGKSGLGVVIHAHEDERRAPLPAVLGEH